MRQATHNTKVALFEISKECEQKFEPKLSYHGHHKVQIRAVKKTIVASWGLQGDMSKSI